MLKLLDIYTYLEDFFVILVILPIWLGKRIYKYSDLLTPLVRSWERTDGLLLRGLGLAAFFSFSEAIFFLILIIIYRMLSRDMNTS